MCTCLRISNKTHYFGRTLDLEFHYNEEGVITPRDYTFSSANSLTFKTKYALIGTAIIAGTYPLYYEAANEYGLAMAGLNFPYNCQYRRPVENMLNLTPFELIPYILGNYKTIKELRKDLDKLNITDVCFMENMPLSPLHWMISDKKECLVIEQTKKGLKIYENPYNVMTNNPTFDLQIENLAKYKNLANEFIQAEDPVYGCVGLGAVGLPGDYSSQSRFVKAHFMAKYAQECDEEDENVSQFFHMLDSVSMVKNTVLTKDRKQDVTFYASCINTNEGIYYYKTYLDSQINVLKLTEENMNSSSLTHFMLITKQKYNYLN